MKPGLFVVAVCLLSVSALAQDETESSALERSLPPQKLQQLAESRDRAQEELRSTATDNLSSRISAAFRDPHGSVAIATMEQIVNYSGSYLLELRVEKVLRGDLPQTVAAKCTWMEGPWILRPPLGLQPIKPENGKRILAAFGDRSAPTRQGEPIYFQGVLNLDDRAEAALLPYALAAAEMDATATISGYEKNLTSENSAVRDIAFHRLMAAKDCPADARCEESIFNEIRTLLAAANPNQRMEGVLWLGQLADAIGDCRMRACKAPQFHAAPVRELLQAAVADQNVAVGDLAFQTLATLDFHKKENGGYCEEIVPAMRTVERYLYTGGKHVIGGSLAGSSVCLAAAR